MLSKQEIYKRGVFFKVQCAAICTMQKIWVREVICRGPHLENSQYLVYCLGLCILAIWSVWQCVFMFECPCVGMKGSSGLDYWACNAGQINSSLDTTVFPGQQIRDSPYCLHTVCYYFSNFLGVWCSKFCVSLSQQVWLHGNNWQGASQEANDLNTRPFFFFPTIHRSKCSVGFNTKVLKI